MSARLALSEDDAKRIAHIQTDFVQQRPSLCRGYVVSEVFTLMQGTLYSPSCQVNAALALSRLCSRTIVAEDTDDHDEHHIQHVTKVDAITTDCYGSDMKHPLIQVEVAHVPTRGKPVRHHSSECCENCQLADKLRRDALVLRSRYQS